MDSWTSFVLNVGLDANKYARTTIPTSEAVDELYTLDCQLTEEERYKNAERWRPICRNCKESFAFDAIVREEVCTGPRSWVMGHGSVTLCESTE